MGWGTTYLDGSYWNYPELTPDKINSISQRKKLIWFRIRLRESGLYSDTADMSKNPKYYLQ